MHAALDIHRERRRSEEHPALMPPVQILEDTMIDGDTADEPQLPAQPIHEFLETTEPLRGPDEVEPEIAAAVEHGEEFGADLAGHEEEGHAAADVVLAARALAAGDVGVDLVAEFGGEVEEGGWVRWGWFGGMGWWGLLVADV